MEQVSRILTPDNPVKAGLRMFGIGLPELILILAIALIVVGPDKLPDLAKTVAKQLLELKKAAGNLKDSLQEEMNQEAAKPAVAEPESKPKSEPEPESVPAAAGQPLDAAVTKELEQPIAVETVQTAASSEAGQQPEPPSRVVGKAG